MRHFLITNKDGSVQVMQLIPFDFEGNIDYSSPEAEIAKWHPSKRDEVASWREIDPEHMPKDRTFRGAWCDGGKTVDVDMPKARDIHRDRLRGMRASKLAALDIEMTRAFDDKAKQADVEKRRQALRDVTADPAIEKASTPEELMAVIPDILK